MATLTFGRLVFTFTASRAEPAGPRLRRRAMLWLRHRRTLAELQDASPEVRRDIGLPPAADPVPGFSVDPRPLWGIGLVPQPRCDMPHHPPRRDEPPGRA